MELTQGHPLKQLFFFALPLVFGTVFQQLYSFVDTVLVGRFLGTDALGAVGASARRRGRRGLGDRPQPAPQRRAEQPLVLFPGRSHGAGRTPIQTVSGVYGPVMRGGPPHGERGHSNGHLYRSKLRRRPDRPHPGRHPLGTFIAVHLLRGGVAGDFPAESAPDRAGAGGGLLLGYDLLDFK